jgi:hypothetical protein
MKKATFKEVYNYINFDRFLTMKKKEAAAVECFETLYEHAQDTLSSDIAFQHRRFYADLIIEKEKNKIKITKCRNFSPDKVRIVR